MYSKKKGGQICPPFFFEIKLASFAAGRDNPFIMRKTIYLLTLTLAFALSAFAQTAPKPPSTHLKVGDAAPELVLNDTDGNTVKLSDFKGKKSVVLAFYVLAFTGG
jgi:hypothetical protein